MVNGVLESIGLDGVGGKTTLEYQDRPDGRYLVYSAQNGVTVEFSPAQVAVLDGLGSAGGFIGGQLAQLIAIKSDIGRLATTTALQTVGSLVGTEIRNRVVGAPDLTDTGIGTAFVQSATSAIGGYAGAQAGSALFGALGIDQTLGRIVGATIGTAVTTTALRELAPVLSQEFGITIAVNPNATFLTDLEGSLPSLGVAVFEQVTGVDPAQAFPDANQQNVQIGEAVGGAIGSIFAEATFGASTVIGQFIGAAIGSLFGHASVGPNAGALVGLNANVGQDHNAFAVTYRGSDNGASASIIHTINGLADTVTALLNAEMDVLAGGSANVGTSLQVSSSYGVQARLFVNPDDHKFHFYTELTGQTGFPNVTSRDFGYGSTSYTDALGDAAMRELALSSFAGGDPAMVNALHNSMLSYDMTYAADALNGRGGQARAPETLAQLNYDLQAVQDYDLYQQNKVAFLVGYALRESQLAQQQPVDSATDFEADIARGGLLQRGYTFTPGQGALVINNYSPTNGGNEGFLSFAYGVSPQDVTLSRSGDDLVLNVGSQGDKVTIQGAFLDLHHALAQINFAYTTVTGTFGDPNNPPSPQQHSDTFFGPELTAAFPPGESGPYPLTGFDFIGDAGAHTRNYDQHSTVVHADGAGLTLTGYGNTVVLTGKGSYLSLTGTGTVLTSNGNNDAASLSGDQVRVTMNGTADQLYLSGSSGILTLNGAGGMYGNDDTLTANGDGTTIAVGGQRDKVAAGNADITVIDGTGTAQGGTLLVTGTDNRVRISNYVIADVEAYAAAVTLAGTLNNVTLGTQYGSLTDTGTGSTVLVNAQDTAVTIAGAGNAGATINGLRNTVAVAGSGNKVAVNGQGSTITLGGAGNTLGTAGNSVAILDGTTGATVTGGGTAVSVGSGVQAAILTSGGEAVTLSGSGTALQISGGYGSTAITGQGNRVVVEGPKSTVVVAGALNAVTVSGAAVQVQVSGAAQTLEVDNGTVALADGAQVTVIGYPNADGSFNVFSNGNRFLLGAGASLSVATGGNNYVEATSNDTVSLNGTGNGVRASGTGNLVVVSGTNTGFGQNAYARMDSGTLVVRTGNLATLTGDANVANVETGSLLHVDGSGNAVGASASALYFDGPARPAPPATSFTVRGFAFPAATAGDYDPASSAGSLAGLAATGANAVELVVTQYLHDDGLPDKDAVTISATGRTESDANLLSEIAAAKAKGLSVLLKPHVDVADGQTWRALLTPADTDRFFANYKAMMVHYAQLAQAAGGVGTFSVGAEMMSLSGPAYRGYWIDVIAAVRQVYSGQVTYASAGFETGNVSFWDKVDVIGANAYERVSAAADPTLAQLEQGWTQPTPQTSGDPIDGQPQTDGFGERVAADGSKSFYSGPIGSAPAGTTAASPVQFYEDLSARYGKQVLFTEAGYASVNETNLLQGDGRRNGTTYVDYQQQALATQAFLDVFTQNKGTWLQGAYLWYWNPNTAGVTADDSSIQDKPALDVVKAYYGGSQASPAAVANAVAGDGNTVVAAAGQALSVNGNGNLVAGGSYVVATGGANAIAYARGQGSLELDARSGSPTGVGPGAASDVLRLGAGIDPTQVSVSGDGFLRLVLDDGAGGDVVQLDGLLSGAGRGVQRVEFANSASWTMEQALARDAQLATLASAQNLLGGAGRDRIAREASGRVDVYEFNDAGALAYGAQLSFGGVVQAIDAGTTVVGTGQNLLGTGGHDLVFRLPDGRVWAREFTSSGELTNGAVLISQGAVQKVDAGTTVIGTGQNLLGTGGHDLVFRLPDGRVWAREFTGSGELTNGAVLTFQGAAQTVEQGTTMVGTGQNLLGSGGHDLVQRLPDGRVWVREFANGGELTGGAVLSYNSTAVAIDGGTAVIGTGQDLFRAGGHDLVLRLADGRVLAWEFGGTGAITLGATLSQGGAAQTVDQGTSVVGTGQNLLGTGGHDLFMRLSDGGVWAREFTDSGELTKGAALTYNGATLLLDQGASVAGTGQNRLGAGGHDLFVQYGTGQHVTWEFDTAGRLLAAG